MNPVNYHHNNIYLWWFDFGWLLDSDEQHQSHDEPRERGNPKRPTPTNRDQDVVEGKCCAVANVDAPVIETKGCSSLALKGGGGYVILDSYVTTSFSRELTSLK